MPAPHPRQPRGRSRSPPIGLLSERVTPSDFAYAKRHVELVCQLAGSPELIDDAKAALRKARVPTAIRTRYTPILFDYLVRTFSFQGVSDAAAEAYLNQHGGVTWHEIEASLNQAPSCKKLQSHWAFHRCDYRKSLGTCAVPTELSRCPLPGHPLRNGKLNQMAYSLFLFIRDVTDNDLVGWIDQQLACASDESHIADFTVLAAALVRPMREIFGVSDKVVTMALSDLLLAGGAGRPFWQQVGGSMIVIDTLVHNFLHRTGIIHRLGSVHAFGQACYQPAGCAEIIRTIAEKIDACVFNSTFPPVFPRFVQHAIWRYCSQAGLDVCNGNKINDRRRCNNVYCRLFESCDRRPLRRSRN